MTQSRFALVFLSATLIAAPALAQSRAMSADDKELASYRLTMDGVNKMARATRALVDEMKKNPKYQELAKVETEVKQLEAKDDLSDAEQKRLEELNAREEQLNDQLQGSEGLFDNADSIDEMAAKVKGYPPLAAALAREGMSPREYAVFMMAMLQASLAAGMQKSGLVKQLPPNVNAENVKFVLDHEAELKKLQESFGDPGK